MGCVCVWCVCVCVCVWCVCVCVACCVCAVRVHVPVCVRACVLIARSSDRARVHVHCACVLAHTRELPSPHSRGGVASSGGQLTARTGTSGCPCRRRPRPIHPPGTARRPATRQCPPPPPPRPPPRAAPPPTTSRVPAARHAAPRPPPSAWCAPVEDSPWRGGAGWLVMSPSRWAFHPPGARQAPVPVTCTRSNTP